MKRIISVLLCAAVILSALAASGCSKEKKTEYADDSAMFFENAATSDNIINAALKDMKFDFGTDTLPEYDSLVTDLKLDFNELTWNGEDYMGDNKVSAVLNTQSNFKDSTSFVSASVSVGDDKTDLSLVSDKYSRFAGIGDAFAKIAPMSAEVISKRLKDLDFLTLVGELRGVYESINKKMSEMKTADDFDEDTETFTANGHEFSAVKKLTLSFDADEICEILDYARDNADENGAAVKLLSDIDRDEIKKSKCTLTDTRYFDDDDNFIREALSLTHPTKITVIKGEDTHESNTAQTSIDPSTTTAASTTTTTAATEASGEMTTTTVEKTDEETAGIYTFNLYHFEDDTQYVVLVSGEFTFYKDYNSKAAAYFIRSKDTGDKASTTDEDVKSAAKLGASVTVMDLDSNTWESSLGGNIYIDEKDSKPVLTYDAMLNVQIGTSSLVGIPCGFVATVDSFDKDGFEANGNLVFDAYGMYVADTDFSLKGKFNEKTDITLPSTDTEMSGEFRTKQLEEVSKNSPKSAELLGKYNSYYESNGFLKINKLEVALENSTKNQYIYLYRDLTGHIDEPFNYAFTDDKMIATDRYDNTKHTDYDYKKGETEDTIILGGNTYTKKDDPTVEGSVYTLGEGEPLKLYLYDNGIGLFRYEIGYNFVPDTGELLFFYLLSHEYSPATLLMNNQVAYLNAEPFTVKSYGFDYSSGDGTAADTAEDKTAG